MIDHRQLNFAWIDFDRHLNVISNVKMATQQRHQPADLSLIEKGWRTTAPVQLRDAASGKQRRTLADFLLQHIQIAIGLVQLARHNLITAAEVAKAMAERNMNIQRQGTFRIAFNRKLEACLAKVLIELQRSGIGGVARTRVIVFFNQPLVPFNLLR